MARKTDAYRRGLIAEILAMALLTLKGYRILAWRWRHPAGEIDIIARRGRVLAAVEVKARPSAAEALACILPPQRKRICRALSAYLSRLPNDARRMIRFDVIAVARYGWPIHLHNAWEAEP